MNSIHNESTKTNFLLCKIIFPFILIIQIILMNSLVLLSLIHELGRFLSAKLCNVGVMNFAFGFGKIVWAKQIGTTTYSIGIIPLGGRLEMAGDGPSAISLMKSKDVADKQQLFLHKKYWQKSLIVLGGPAALIIFAFIVSFLSHAYFGIEVPSDKPIVGSTFHGAPARIVGLKPKDLVVSIDGYPIDSWTSLSSTIASSAGNEMSIAILRDNRPIEVKVTARAYDPKTGEALFSEEQNKKQALYRIGITPIHVRKPFNIIDVFYLSLEDMATHRIILTTFATSPTSFFSTNEVRKRVAFPISSEESEYKSNNWLRLIVSWIFFSSVFLALLYLMPLPFFLGGGHFLFFTVEALIGRHLQIEYMKWANRLGLTVLPIMVVLSLFEMWLSI